MTKELDFSKPVETLDKKPVRILSTDGPDSNFPIIGVIGDERFLSLWSKDGEHYFQTLSPSRNNLIQVPKKQKLYLNVYRNDSGSYNFGSLYLTRSKANSLAKERNYCKTVEIEIELD